MAHLQTMTCCGIKEIHGIQRSSPVGTLKDIGRDWFLRTPRAFLIFSCKSVSSAGFWLSLYIRVYGLGKVTAFGPRLNPNSKNQINIYVWDVNNDAFKRWLDKKKPGWDVVSPSDY